MVTAGAVINFLGSFINYVLGTILNVAIAVLGELFTLILTVFYYPLACILHSFSRIITGAFMQGLYAEAVGVTDGPINKALHGMLSYVGDIQNIFVVYSVCFIILAFMVNICEKAAKMRLTAMDMFKSLIIMTVSVFLSFNCCSIVTSIIGISEDLAAVVYDVLAPADKDISEDLSNSILTVRIIQNGEPVDPFKLREELARDPDMQEEGITAADGAEKEAETVIATIEGALNGTEARMIEAGVKLLISLLGGIFFFILPAAVSLMINIYCLSFFITRVIELVVYSSFLPVAISDVYSHGLLGSRSMKYIRKIITLAFQGMVIYLSLALSQTLIGIIGLKLLSGSVSEAAGMAGILGGSASNLGKVSLFFIIIITIEITMFSLARKSQETASDIAG